MAHLRFALDEGSDGSGLEGLCLSRVRDVALVWIELAGREEPARRNKRLVQLVYHRGFADTGITGNERDLGGTMSHDPVESCEHCVDLALSPIQLFWNQHSVRRVVRAQREWIDASMRLLFREAPPNIGFEAGGGLVALLGVFGEELHGWRRQRLGDRSAITWWCRLACERGSGPTPGVGGGKRQLARRSVQAPCRRGCRNNLGRNPEGGEPYVADVVDEHVRRLNVLLNQATPVDLAERSRQANRDAEDAGQIDWLRLFSLKDQIQGLTARVREYKDRSPLVTGERQRLGSPRGIELGCARVLVFEAPESLRRSLFRG